ARELDAIDSTNGQVEIPAYWPSCSTKQGLRLGPFLRLGYQADRGVHCGTSHERHVDRFKLPGGFPARPFLKRDARAFRKLFDAIDASRNKHEKIRAAAVGLDEAEAFFTVEPLHNASRHLFVFSYFQ